MIFLRVLWIWMFHPLTRVTYPRILSWSERLVGLNDSYVVECTYKLRTIV